MELVGRDGGMGGSGGGREHGGKKKKRALVVVVIQRAFSPNPAKPAADVIDDLLPGLHKLRHTRL